MKEKSLKGNMVLNSIKSIMSIVFPIITFPYISKVLQVDNIGKYNFSNSIVSYFALFAGLGISSYAIREGARFRNNKTLFDDFANEMFSISIISTIVAYLLLIFCLIFVEKFHAYSTLIIILSLQIIFKTIGIEWIYSIYEDYAYITIRSIAFQIISLILLFILVKHESDYIKYAAISVIASVGSNILNYLHVKKYCKVKFTRKIDWKKHLKPIMIIFSTSIATIIYVSSDTTILGFLCNDYVVGLYSVSVKIYTIIKTILASILIVSIPRLSSYLGQKNNEMFLNTAKRILELLTTIMLPAVIGLFVLSREVVLFISDKTYLEATTSLRLLCVSMAFCIYAWFWGQCILLPLKLEKAILKATIVGAIINLVLNLIIIPFWKQNAAAFTTVVAEAIAMLICIYEAKRKIEIPRIMETLIKSSIGCVLIVCIVSILKIFELSNTVYLILSVAISCVAYLVIEILLKNNAVLLMKIEIKNKF